VETPIRPDYEDFHDLPLNPFPISREGQVFNLLNIHYLNLNRLPALELPVKYEKLQWMSLHHGLAFSNNEKIARENSARQDPGSLISLKESIAAVFFRWAGVEKSSENVKSRFHPLGLYNPSGEIGIYTLIFVNDIRFDLASHTIVADACVVPLSQKNAVKLLPSFGRIAALRHVLINTPDDETKLWKFLLPALAERCRTWKHLPTCEYLLQGIPAYMEGLKFEASPLCSCGMGKDLGTFGTRPEWKEFHSEATRIALSPLFSSSFIKIPHGKTDVKNANIGSPLKSPASETSQSITQCANCGGPGQPSLLSCSVCKQTKYCSRSCQKSHWKTHKLHCSKASS
jgi:MYND finger